MSETLTLKITGEDRRGCLDGVTATDFPVGSVHTFSGRLGLDLGRAFLRYEWAEEHTPEPEPAAAEAAEPKQEPEPENKQAPAPKTTKAAPRRRRAPRKRKPKGF